MILLLALNKKCQGKQAQVNVIIATVTKHSKFEFIASNYLLHSIVETTMEMTYWLTIIIISLILYELLHQHQR